MRKIILLFFTAIMASITTFGQESNIETWKTHIDYIDSQYTELPQQKLDSITKALDSTAISNHCYKFITNSDKSKFLAFYLTDRNNQGYNAIKREYGGTYRSSTWGKMREDQVEAFAYTVRGMYFEGKWYYDLDEYVRFYANSVGDAKSIFLIRTLLEDKFFKTGKTPIENIRFWKKNQFKKSYMYRDDYPDYPELVAASITGKKTRTKYNSNKITEKLACKISSSLWNYLQNSDSDLHSNRYKGTYMDDYCLCLYNSKRNIILLPMLFYDNEKQAHLSYYIAKLASDDDVTLFKWKTFPDKEVNRPPGDESHEVIYDIRNFIKNWGWGTTNMISTKSFWEENFTDSDLEVAKYQYKKN